MKQIILEVDDETAKGWHSISSVLQKQITTTLGELIIQADKKTKETNVGSHLQETHELTDEGLAKLLDEEG